jgi:hypothetical protein
MRPRSALGLLYAFAIPLALAAACGGGDDGGADPIGDPEPIDDAGTGGRAPSDASTDGTSHGGCRPEGYLVECSVDLGMQGNVHSCFHGWQMCLDGSWTDCVDLEDLPVGAGGAGGASGAGGAGGTPAG